MTRNREIPDPWPDWNPSQSDQLNNWQGNNGNLADKPPWQKRTSKIPGSPSRMSQSSPSQPLRQDPKPGEVPTKIQSRTVVTASSPPPPGPPTQVKRLTWSFGWQFWAALVLLLSSGLGLAAAAMLLKLPALPNCPKMFRPVASASTRIYCAQLAASKQTAEDLLEAIALVKALPEDHPLHLEINRNIEEWSLDILKIGDEKFQAGELEEAIKIAKRIPSGVSAHELVEERIASWQKIWSEAEELFTQADQELRKSNWNEAFRKAVELTYVDNKYWATDKYDELTGLIQIAQEESAKLDKAYKLSRSSKVANILEAIKQADEIRSESYAYKEAQDLIATAGKKLVNIALERVEKRDGQGVLEIANQLPASVKQPEMQSDLQDIGNALSRAEGGTAWDLEEAIASLEKLVPERPLYKQGQQLVGRWQKEVKALATLERARMFANSGLSADLRTAITEARQIPPGNPRYQEARAEIQRWTTQVQTSEDQPYLDRAVKLASFGGVPSLQEAVQEASRVAPGRSLYPEAKTKIDQWNRTIQQLEDQPYLERAQQIAINGDIASLQQAIQVASNISAGRTLYKEAQTKIGQWRSTIERREDQPYLEQARSLAAGGNLSAAISAAQQIRRGRNLYGEAQSSIKNWQREIDGQRLLQEAYQKADSGTPEALSEAIRVARQIPTSARTRSEVPTLVNRWSYQILAMAKERSSFDLARAIAIARLIPSGTAPYEAAQAQIQSWQNILEPPPLILETQPSVDPG